MDVVVPSPRSAEQLSKINEALIWAIILLERGMPKGSNEHEERYNYLTQRALDAPFLALETSDENNYTWTNQRISIDSALKSFLPASIMEAIKRNVPAIQQILDGRAEVNSLFTCFYSSAEGSKRTAQFKIVKIPHWESSIFEVHFVEIAGSFNSALYLGFFEAREATLQVRYNYQKFTASTVFLLKEMELSEEEVRQSMDTWFAGNRMITA